MLFPLPQSLPGAPPTPNPHSTLCSFLLAQKPRKQIKTTKRQRPNQQNKSSQNNLFYVGQLIPEHQV